MAKRSRRDHAMTPTDRIKTAAELPGAGRNGSGPQGPSVCTPVEIGEFVELAQRFLPEKGDNSPNSTGVYVQKAIYPEDSILADWMRLAREHEESADALSSVPFCRSAAPFSPHTFGFNGARSRSLPIALRCSLVS